MSSKLEKDLIFAIHCLDATGEHSDIVSKAKDLIKRDDGIDWLVQALSDLYAEAGVTSVGLPVNVLQSQVMAKRIAKALELVNAYRAQKKSSSENNAAPHKSLVHDWGTL